MSNASSLAEHQRILMDLRKAVQQEGLDDRRLGRYIPYLMLTTSLLIACWVVLPYANGQPWVVLALGVAVALLMGQIGLLAHDASHRQMSPRGSVNRSIALGLWSGLLGVSETWWRTKHDTHHASPNVVGVDPDISPQLQALLGDNPNRSGITAFLQRHANLFVMPILSAQALQIRVDSFRFMRSLQWRSHWPEITLALSLNVFLFLWPMYCLGVWQGLGFYLFYHILLGLYLGLVFAPNHVGRPLLAPSDVTSSLERQVATSRNIKVHRYFDWIFGGLNFQIEHHVFPNVPSTHLKMIRPKMQQACRAANLEYCEMSFSQSIQDVVDAVKTKT